MSGLFNTGKISTLMARLSQTWAENITSLATRVTAARAGNLDNIHPITGFLDKKISEVGGKTYNSLLITTSTTHSWPTGFKGTVFVSMAAGGGGGAYGHLGFGGDGGHGGECIARMPIYVDQTLSASVSITIGGGGAGGTSQFGTAGGGTVFGSYLTLNGGSGGGVTSNGTPGVDADVTTLPLNINLPEAINGGRKATLGSGAVGNGSGEGGEGGISGATAGDGLRESLMVATLDNTGVGGNPSGGEGGGGGGSWGDGGDNSAPTKGGGGRGGNNYANGQNGASGFVFLEWWE